MMIKHVFLDLDRTLWDFNANSRLELASLWKEFKLHQKGISLPDQFIKIYEKINNECWAKYRLNEITKEELRGKRFLDTLAYFGIEDVNLAEEIGLTYIQNSPNRTVLVEGAIETLTYLKARYKLHIITNGFKEVQYLKLDNCGLMPFFEQVITSEEVGVMKPNSKVFEYALKKANASKKESVYVGDDYIVDIEGAMNTGLQTIFFNPNKKQHSLSILGDITELQQIKNIL
jgi:putative hydrolase of the HAD superfamily